MLDPFGGFLVAAQFEKRLAFQLQQIILGKHGAGGNIAPADDISDDAANLLFIRGDIASLFHVPEAGFDARRDIASWCRDIVQRLLGAVVDGQSEHLLFGVSDQAIEIHADAVTAAHVVQFVHFSCAHRHGGHADLFEIFEDKGGWIDITVARQFDGPQAHFFGPTTCRDQTHADFDQSHVGFRIGIDGGGMEAEFTAAAEGHTERRGYHRHLGIFDSHGGFLEGANHHVDVLKGSFRQGDGKQHQVGADGKVGTLVADDQSDTFCFRALDGFVGHGQNVAADGVHLGVKFKTEDPVTQIEQRAVGIFLNHTAAFLQNLQVDFAGL